MDIRLRTKHTAPQDLLVLLWQSFDATHELILEAYATGLMIKPCPVHCHKSEVNDEAEKTKLQRIGLFKAR